MRYALLSGLYEQLEKTPAKLKKTELIADLLKKTRPKELHKVVLLLVGRAFPGWSGEELGVAGQLMVRAISKAFGVNEAEIAKKFKETGDLGLTAESFARARRQRTLARKELDVEDVFSGLQDIAKQTGAGSQDRKLNLIAGLMAHAGPKEVRYIVRTVLQELRVGVAEGILRDAIAQAFGLDAKTVENAWFLRPDYGEIAQIAKEKGKPGLEAVKIELGMPMMVLLAEKSPDLKTALEAFEHAAMEFKYDGMRCISGFTPIYTRDKGIVTVQSIKIGDFILTHRGRYKKVVAKNARTIEKDERVFSLHTYLGNRFMVTEGHKFLIWTDNHAKWVPIERVQKNAELVFPIPKPPVPKKEIPNTMILSTIDGYTKKFKLNKNFYRFLGYWIGDGFTNTNNRTHRVGLVFNAKEQELADFYKGIVSSELGIRNIGNNIHNGAIYLYWTDRPMLKWLSRNFRNPKQGWKGKALPEWFWNVSRENFLEFLKGWIEADGTTDKQGRTSLIIKERRLATFAHILGLRFSVITSLKKVRISGNTYYKLLFIRKNVARIYKDKLLVKILRKEELSRHHPRGIDPRSRVYNLQVEGDESYCTTLAALHNCQIHKKGEKLWLFTRRLENVTAAFPDVVEMCRRAIKARECIIEGEALAIDPKTHRPMPFQMLSTRIKRKYGIEKARKEMPVQVNLFDIVYLDGRSLFQEPLKERDRALKSVVKPIPGKFQFAEKLITKDLKKAEAFYKKSLAAGQEGLMVKNLDARYQPGRRVAGGWLKVKPVMESLDLAIIGATWGTGKRAGWLGSLILGCRDPESGKFLECGMLGTGIKEKKTKPEDVTFLDMTNMLKPHIEQEKGGTVKIKPKVVIEVAYEEIQKSPTYASGWALRFPRFIRLRLDKSPAEADTRERIKSLYKIQKGKK